MTSEAIARIAPQGVLPVIVIDDVALAAPLAHCLVRAGLTSGEVTLRTETAFDCIAAMAEVDGFLVGAGTVLTAAQASLAASAGARFFVAPGLDQTIVEAAEALTVPLVPGIATATELTRALSLGIDVVKLFPAEHLGGVGLLDALGGPFPVASFLPTGGINAERAKAYLARTNVMAVGGSWMVRPELLVTQQWDTIGQLATEAAGLRTSAAR